jgi:hypothetical protein
VVEADVADRGANHDNPRIFVLHETLHPTFSNLGDHRTNIAGAASIHAHDLGMDSQSKARRGVL